MRAPAITAAEATLSVSSSQDPREINATPQLGRFLVLAGQLGLLFLVFNIYHTMDKPVFVRLAGIVFGAFLAHYWLPFRWKEPFWVAVSIAGSFLLVETRVALLVLLC